MSELILMAIGLRFIDLLPRQRIDVTIRGTVQIFSGFRSFPHPTEGSLADNLKPTDFWQAADPEIKKLALELKTPEAIYDYVVKTLKYDYSRVRPNVERLGALAALKSPNTAILHGVYRSFYCISARASGIPTRRLTVMLIQKTRRFNRFLWLRTYFAWPEYYDKEEKVWIPIDPTWGSTTGGVDFLTSLILGILPS